MNSRRQHNRDRKNIFKHYAKMNHDELKGSEKKLKAHIAQYEPQGIHTTPEHMQSIKYHLKNSAKHTALKKKTSSMGSNFPNWDIHAEEFKKQAKKLSKEGKPTHHGETHHGNI